MKKLISMNKIITILTIFYCLIFGNTIAQVISNNGVVVTIPNGIVLNGGSLNNSSGTVSNNGAMILSGDVTNGGTMDGDGSYTISGNWVNNNTFAQGASTVNFIGNTSQNISGSVSTVFNNINLDNTSGMTLSLYTLINGNLTFVNGKISTQSNTLYMGNSSTVSGAGVGKYVFGTLQKGIAATLNLSKTFEVGDSLIYAPVTVDFNGTPNATGSLTVNTTSGQHANIFTSGINPSRDVARYWSITNSGVTSYTSYSPTFNFFSGDIIGSADASIFHVKEWNNSAWNSTTDGIRTGTSTQCTGMTTFSDFAVGETCVTPVAGILNNTGTTVITCNNPSINLTATGSGNYLWDNGSTNQNRTVIIAGTYSVSVINPAGGCFAVGSVTITSIPLPILTTANTNIQCYGQATGTATVSVTYLAGPFTYLWSPSGQTTFSATNLIGGNYTVAVTDTNGCTTTSNVIHITQPSPLTLAGATHFSYTNITCFGAADGIIRVNPAGGIAPYSYSWTPSIATTATVSNLTPGTYSVLVTDFNGCTKQWGATINQSPSPITLTLSQTNVLGCNGDSTGIVIANPTGGMPGYLYTWSPSIGTAATVSNLASGSYAVTVTDVNGCTKYSGTLITQPTVVLISAPDHYSKTDLACYGGNTGIIRINPTGGTPGYSYVWSPSQGNHATVSTLTAGAYNITVSDAHGCTRVINANITQPTPINYTSVVTNVSGCGSLGSIVLTASGGTGIKTYSKNNGSTYQTAASFTNLTPATYTVKIKDVNGCVSAATNIPITTNNALAFTTTVVNATGCALANGKITVVASGGSGVYSYSKDSGITYQTANVFYSLLHGVYKIRVKDVLGCYSNINAAAVGPICKYEDMETNLPVFGALSAYPIPADDHITVSFTSDIEQHYHLRLTDVFGRAIVQDNPTSVIGNNQYQIDLTYVAKGVYFIILQQGEAVLQTKIVVQ